VTEGAHIGNDPAASPAADSGRAPLITIDRVGPGGGVASDSAFGVALVTLWQRAAEAGAPVGFAAPVLRSDVAARAAGLVDEIKTGRLIAVAANRARRLIGVGFLRPGRGSGQHTGHLELVLIDAEHTRAGLGTRLVDQLLGRAAELGLERVDAAVPADPGLESFFGTLGFVEWGRRPRWIRMSADDERDEVLLGVEP
jgi:GNAT superfamily N-acetyltransferase